MTDTTNEFEKWYLTRYIPYLDISDMFAGLGTLLIDGDTLIQYICERNGTQRSQQVELSDSFLTHLNKFLNTVKQAGFDKVKVVFFNVHSKWTINDSRIKLELENAFKLSSVEFVVFSDWQGNKELKKFISDEQINLLLTSEYNIYRARGSQYSFICEMCKLIQVSIITSIKLSHSSIKAFLVHPGIETRVSDISKLRDNFTIKTHDDSDSGKEESDENRKIKTYQITCPNINRLLKAQSNVYDLSNLANNLDFQSFRSSSTWEIDIKLYERAWAKNNPLTDNQKYYRFMERYSTSLNACKHLHHKILTTSSDVSGKQLKYVKQSKKELLIIKQQEKIKQSKREEKDMEMLATFEKTCFSIEQLDDYLKNTRMESFCKSFLFNLAKFKLKLHTRNTVSSNSTTNQKTAHIFLLIRELVESYAELLTET
jgi:hypothetical protein